jgi:hypothetical protein
VTRADRRLVRLPTTVPHSRRMALKTGNICAGETTVLVDLTFHFAELSIAPIDGRAKCSFKIVAIALVIVVSDLVFRSCDLVVGVFTNARFRISRI